MVRHGDHGVNESVAAMTRPRHEQEVSVSASWPQQYPGLFDPHPASWDGTERDYLLQFTLDLPSDNLVVNVRLVAVSSQGLVVCRAAEGWRFLPGGSREQAESLEETATRELMEEAGCVLTGPVSWFGSFSVTNPPGSQPWRPWHPWPVTSWLVGVASVKVVRSPTNPDDGEVVVEVLELEPSEAIDYLSEFDNGGQADLVRLAVDLGLVKEW